MKKLTVGTLNKMINVVDDFSPLVHISSSELKTHLLSILNSPDLLEEFHNSINTLVDAGDELEEELNALFLDIR